jgi:tetratricopeptide (TPR) repeat protein
LDSFVVFDDIELAPSDTEAQANASPADLAREHTLRQMADAVFAEETDPSMLQANMALARAADLQARGLVAKAIEAYHSAIQVGADNPEAHFNLGLLYADRRDFPRAIDHLHQAITSPELIAGAHFAIAECYHAWGKTIDALPHLLQVLRNIDEQTVSEERTGALRTTYEEIGRGLAERGKERTGVSLALSALSFFHDPDWVKNAMSIREQLDALTGDGILITLAETLSEANIQVAVSSMRQIQNYLNQDMLFTALEECFWAIQRVPYYLPLHLRLANILVTQGRQEEAVSKYTTIAETYQVRGQQQRAIAIYRKALNLAPMDIEVRERLIHLLLANRLYDQAIEQYMSVADAFYQLAQVNRAIETYTEALRYANHGDPARHWEASILHRIGDIYTQRLNWKQAIRAYQRIKRVEPENDKARSYLVDLHLKTGQKEEALQELDDLIDFHRGKGEAADTLALLQDMVQSRPDELAFHIRLARLYLELKKKREALAELDTIGELQLNSGMTQEAIRTIQAIIRLQPDNTADYQRLLAQLQA